MTKKSENRYSTMRDEYLHPESTQIVYIIILIAVAIIYFAVREFVPAVRFYIDLNLNYIWANIDVAIMFIVAIIVPIIMYIIFILVIIVHFFWYDVSTAQLRAGFDYFRFNFSVVVGIMTAMTFLFKIPFTTWYSILIGIVVVIILDIFFISFKDMLEEEKKRQHQIGTPEASFGAIIVFMIIGICLIVGVVIYFNNSSFEGTVNSVLNTVSSDIVFETCVYIALILSFFLPLFSLIADFVARLFEKYHDTIIRVGKFLFFLMILYLIVKLVMFNVATFAPEPYPTLLSVGASAVGGIITRYSGEIGAWRGRWTSRWH